MITRIRGGRVFRTEDDFVDAVTAAASEEEIGVDEIQAVFVDQDAAGRGRLERGMRWVVVVVVAVMRRPSGRLPVSNADVPCLVKFGTNNGPTFGGKVGPAQVESGV